MKRVLIIEDNLEIQEIYKINFESEDFMVKTSPDWLEGIVTLLEFKPDIIVLDIMMPKMDGFEFLKTIQEQSSIKIPIIICSNLNSKNDEKKAFLYWANLYLRKSDYEWYEIVEKAKKLLEN